MISPEQGAVILGAALALLGLLLTAYAKTLVVDGIKDYLTNALPGLIAIEISKWSDRADNKYASSDRMKTLEARVNGYEQNVLAKQH